jgi:DNA polymerase-1
VEYTATGQASTSGAAIRKLAGDPFSVPPRYGTAYEGAGGGEEGRRACEALSHLLEAESISKLLNNFLETLPKQADAGGRIHTSINLNTETGRLSSQRPNLQNQPALEKDIYRCPPHPPPPPPSGPHASKAIPRRDRGWSARDRRRHPSALQRGTHALNRTRRRIRKAFTASAGKRLIVVDYGQLELRIMAHMARCR